MSFIAPQLMSHPDKARKLEAETELKTIKNALQLYYLDHKRYPSINAGLDVLYKGDQDGNKYLADSPIDPWDAPYVMRNEQGSIVILSSGPDKEFGTQDDLQEIIN